MSNIVKKVKRAFNDDDDTLTGAIVGGVFGGLDGAIVGGLVGGVTGGIIGGVLGADDDNDFGLLDN